jgi:hypothetical protein
VAIEVATQVADHAVAPITMARLGADVREPRVPDHRLFLQQSL